MKNNKPSIIIYTDGSCSGNPGVGGWGALLVFGENKKEISGFVKNTTNNQMEIIAAIEALQVLKTSCTINLYTDSIYLKRGITSWIQNWKKNNWQKKDRSPVKNISLWKKLQDKIQEHEVTWHWVRGHANNHGNNIADKLATEACNHAKNKYCYNNLNKIL